MMTFGDIKAFVAPFAHGGVCPDDPRCIDAVNEAVERLVGKPNLTEKLTIRAMRITAWGNMLTLPRIVDRVLKVRYDGDAVSAHSRWYEFMANGPGFARDDSLGYQDLIDRGETPVQYDIPSHADGYHLLVLSDHEEDTGTRVRVRGLDETGREVLTDGMGELIPITGGHEEGSYATFSTALFSDIINVSKPRTNGYVYLSTWDPDTGERFHLATYHPDETTPSYRRYSLKGWNFDSDAVPYSHSVFALAKLRAVPATRDEDPLLIDNRSAIKAMVQALYNYDSGSPKEGASYEGIAEKILLDETINYALNPAEGLDIQEDAWFGGDIPNLQ